MPDTTTALHRAEIKQLKLDVKAARLELKTIDTNMRSARKQVKNTINKAQANLRAAEREANAHRKGIARRQAKLAKRIAIVKGRLS